MAAISLFPSVTQYGLFSRINPIRTRYFDCSWPNHADTRPDWNIVLSRKRGNLLPMRIFHHDLRAYDDLPNRNTGERYCTEDRYPYQCLVMSSQSKERVYGVLQHDM